MCKPDDSSGKCSVSTYHSTSKENGAYAKSLPGFCLTQELSDWWPVQSMSGVFGSFACVCWSRGVEFCHY